MDITTLTLRSGAFFDGDSIPKKYTCMGKNVSPPLSWQGVPAAAKSLVLIIDDPEAPDPMAPKMDWVHWILYNIPTSAESLPEGVMTGHLPVGAEQGLNDWNEHDYRGPCPPIGMHHYHHRLFALDQTLQAMQAPDREHIIDAMRNHVLAKAELIGTFTK